ncbi:molecular chaperone MKKS-like [Ruditapes philippinarum]|uniref:molecular chaperone MKKS-like n=1 Tax=Ruditapes philippinarum TaxID=129788 RepID=UPI00295B2E73|nr:molecular chaperone MKKS-like [Ruditapes philippinarum]
MSSIKVTKDSSAIVQRSRLLGFRESVANFLQLTRSCHTPRGKMIVLQNTSGGCLTLTSSSRRLLQCLSVKKPVIQLLVSATQGHLSAFSDAGLFLSSFAADLVIRSIDCCQSEKILAEVYELFLTLSLDYLNSDDCGFKYPAIISDLSFMKIFVRSILGTKQLPQWNGIKLGHISNIIIETFLQCVTDGSRSLHVSDNICVMASLGLDVLNSYNVSGVLLPAPEMSKFKARPLKPKRVNLHSNNSIKVALITTSMSGDLDELAGVRYEVSQNIPTDGIIIDDLSNICDTMVQFDVGLVLCQRVMHPKLKHSLHKSGLIVVDRIGLQLVKYIINLTGCVPIQCAEISLSENIFGYIDDVQHVIVNKLSYLHLTRADNPVSTLMLYHHQEEPLNELKDVCLTSLDSLQQLVYDPTVLAGAGCWQVGLANYLTGKIEDKGVELSEELECLVITLQQACTLFVQALLSASLTDVNNYSVSRNSGHVFRSSDVTKDSNKLGNDNKRCSCGIYKAKANENLLQLTENDSFYLTRKNGTLNCEKCPLTDAIEECDEVVIDSFTVGINALQTAVLTACSVLKIGQVVENL